ncbi:MAG: hypothetical protein HY040_12660, partial [Planctomycetes bacterium]|nr:hypothetical protein [Planctomycetota bacterium]
MKPLSRWLRLHEHWDHLFGGFLRRRRRHRPHVKRRSVQPEVEALEKRWLPSSGVTEYTLTTASSQPHGITVGSDTNLWVTESAKNKIAKVTTSGGITEYTVPTASSTPWDIVAGPDSKLWFTENGK